MLSPVISLSCAARVHPADKRATASTATLRTMVAIPATSMLEIRLDAMHHSWRQSSGSVDLDQAAPKGGTETIYGPRPHRRALLPGLIFNDETAQGCPSRRAPV